MYICVVDTHCSRRVFASIESNVYDESKIYDEPSVSGHLLVSRGWPLNGGSTVKSLIVTYCFVRLTHN